MTLQEDMDEARQALAKLGSALAEALYLPQITEWLDRTLRRWPWLYRKLG